jgi:hypothetical protein
MGWAYCGEDDLGRPIGYGVEATCDEPGCGSEIHRGLDYVCGGMHGGGDHGCGRYFCSKHLPWVCGAGDEHFALCRTCGDAWWATHPDDEDPS